MKFFESTSGKLGLMPGASMWRHLSEDNAAVRLRFSFSSIGYLKQVTLVDMREPVQCQSAANGISCVGVGRL
ncbi:hypothetical protein T4B_4374 [Trichinella pseudospiralis]|uniref:Uncharacterized protein n=1 Tax=Trichinella pseudospiralis TaxID=6337 RepID=A0A0V1INT2_TRIPS|nr:hypothetical protein T4B_4374 [Trichinella pseudospiralis]